MVALFIRSVFLLTFGFFAVSGTVFAQATATPTAVACVSAPTGIQIVLENPQPGDTLMSGTQVVMNGSAYDTGATTGSGIASVTVYLGDRDAGGLALGTATLGQPNPAASPGSQFANAGFTLRTAPLPNGSGARTIFVYARSIVGNAEAVLQVPIFLNTRPTPVRGQVPTPVVPPLPACTPVPAATPTVEATPTPLIPAAAAATATPTSRATPTPFSLPAPLPPAPAPNQPAAAPPAAPAAAGAQAPPVAVAPAQATAPRGGGVPSEVGLLVLGVGAAIVAGGLALHRRERQHR